MPSLVSSGVLRPPAAQLSRSWGHQWCPASEQQDLQGAGLLGLGDSINNLRSSVLAD
jgi:hypothetical protein